MFLKIRFRTYGVGVGVADGFTGLTGLAGGVGLTGLTISGFTGFAGSGPIAAKLVSRTALAAAIAALNASRAL